MGIFPKNKCTLKDCKLPSFLQAASFVIIALKIAKDNSLCRCKHLNIVEIMLFCSTSPFLMPKRNGSPHLDPYGSLKLKPVDDPSNTTSA
jgi:hypothetical protein